MTRIRQPLKPPPHISMKRYHAFWHQLATLQQPTVVLLHAHQILISDAHDKQYDECFLFNRIPSCNNIDWPERSEGHLDGIPKLSYYCKLELLQTNKQTTLRLKGKFIEGVRYLEICVV